MENADVATTPEIPKKGAPIHIILERHDDVRGSSLAQLDRTVREKLRPKESGDIVVFFEASTWPISMGTQIQEGIRAGYSLSESFAITNFIGRYNRLPDLHNQSDIDEMIRMYNDDELVHQKTRDTFAVLDEHFPQGKRLRVLFEGIPDEQFDEEMQEHARFEHVRMERYTYVLEGNFDQGIESYKEQQKIRAHNSITREDRFAKRIADASQEDNVIAVVGQIGGAHSRLGDILKEQGHGVIQGYADEDVSTTVDDLGNDIIRKLQKSPEPAISDFEWYRSMIDSVMDDLAATWTKQEKEQPGSTADSLQWIPYVETCKSRLTDMDSIRRFESDIREGDFWGAVANSAE